MTAPTFPIVHQNLPLLGRWPSNARSDEVNLTRQKSKIFATLPKGEGFPVRKRYASIVDDGKTAFEQGRKHRQNRHKNPATSIVAAFADRGG